MNINNDFYETLGEGWFQASDHPIALLRAENRLRNPWILSQLQPKSQVVDLGCGAGFLAHALAQAGHEVTGVDLSASSLQEARKRDLTRKIQFYQADAQKTPLPPHSFDVVCAMDLLEHVPEPREVIAEASRLLRPGGLFFFHTFNRTPLSWLLVIKGVEWCVKNTPPRMHVYSFFIRPAELAQWCQLSQMDVRCLQGVDLKWNQWATWKMVLTRTVPEELQFQFTASLRTGYCGFAHKLS